MSRAQEIVSLIADMAAAQEYLLNKPSLSEEEGDLLVVCNEGFKALEDLAQLFNRYAKGISLPRGDNYSAIDALAFGAALHDTGVFGHHKHHPDQNESISSELEQTQVEEFQAMMGSLDSEG